MIPLTAAEARRLFNLYTRVARPRAFHEHCQTGDADRGGQPCPAGIAPIRLSIAETIRLTVLASQHAARLITRARLSFALVTTAQAAPGCRPLAPPQRPAAGRQDRVL